MPYRDETDATAGPTRRTVLRGAVLAGAAVPFLAACGSAGGSSPASTTSGAKRAADSPPAGSASAGGSDGAHVIAATSDVPEGAGIILDDVGVVITQPEPGTFKGFTNICTHQQCPVDNVTDGTINCICHGSMFSIEDGSVVGGPAPAPLAAKQLRVKGNDIALA